MSTTNTRNKPVFANREEFEAKVDEIAILMVQHKKAIAAKDEATQIAREPYEAKIEELDALITQGLALCEPYALQNRDTLLTGKKKSAKTMLATWSLKKGKEKIEVENADAVIARARELNLDGIIRQVASVSKQDLAKLPDEQLKALGVVRLAAVDSFGITPKDNAIDDEN